VLAALIAASAAPPVVPAHATANYSYKKNEYLVIAGGTAPSKRLSIAAHGAGEFSYDNFHLYQMAEPAHRKLARLQKVGPDDILDTAAPAFQARWAGDSHHVAVLFRSERHVIAVRLYAIGNRGAHLLTGPDLLQAAAENRTFDDYDLRVSHSEFAWLGPTQFVSKEDRIFATSSPEVAQLLGAFGKPIPRKGPPEEKPGDVHLVRFSAQPVCELGPGNRYRVIDLKPGAFEY
jgi:hypothetical protein